MFQNYNIEKCVSGIHYLEDYTSLHIRYCEFLAHAACWQQYEKFLLYECNSTETNLL